jgi:hypothetical protein
MGYIDIRLLTRIAKPVESGTRTGFGPYGDIHHEQLPRRGELTPERRSPGYVFAAHRCCKNISTF